MSQLSQVRIDSNVYEIILGHAFSNSNEEIMGLLIGNIDIINNEEVSNVLTLILLERVDKKPDRVEISPEQLSSASEHAEKLSKDLNQVVQIIGWYHSHPNITVWPSHVDIRTQGMYQTMDKNFIGIIASVFNQLKTHGFNQVELICFQSNERAAKKFATIPFEIFVFPRTDLLKTNLQLFYELANVFLKEEKSEFENKTNNKPNNLLSKISNTGLYLHKLSKLIEASHLGMIDALRCKQLVNTLFLNYPEYFQSKNSSDEK